MEEKSLSWWGDVTTANKDEIVKKNKEIIGQRVELFRTIKTILENADIEFFIEGGTLLGAYRNGQFIYHDNDMGSYWLYWPLPQFPRQPGYRCTTIFRLNCILPQTN